MSIEELLLELTASLNNNTFAMKELTKRLDAQTTPTVKAVDPQPVKAERTIEQPKTKAVEPKTKAVEPEPKAEVVIEKPKAEAKAAPAQLTYADVAKELQAVMTAKGRDALVALLAKLGAPNGKAIKEEDYPRAIELAKAAL